jgi:leucyl-tRNA synthetase
MRFVSPRYEDGPFDPAALAAWGPPDLYVGGAEHAVMHLLYARFWTKVMADAGIIPFREPFPALRSQGIMHARDPQTGEVRRMAKSAGNVVTPDSVAVTHGADALRVYLLFMAPFENNTVWEEEGIVGAKRFLQRVWRLAINIADTDQPTNKPTTQLTSHLHQIIQRVTTDVKAFKFNTAVAALMGCLNSLTAHHQAHGVTAELAEATRTFVLLLAPFAPHIAEELWARLGGSHSVHQQAWPIWDEALAAEEIITLVVQVDGRVRDKLAVSADISEAEARELALDCDGVRRHLGDRRVARVIYVPGRLVNVVT